MKKRCLWWAKFCQNTRYASGFLYFAVEPCILNLVKNLANAKYRFLFTASKMTMFSVKLTKINNDRVHFSTIRYGRASLHLNLSSMMK